MMENKIMKTTITKNLHPSAVLLAAAIILTATLSTAVPAHEIDQTSRVIWPDPTLVQSEVVKVNK